VPEWFVAKRGLALGVLFAGKLNLAFVKSFAKHTTGTAAGGLVLPLILSPILEKLGPYKALRILSGGFAIVLLPVIPFIRGRLPISRVHGPATRSSSNLFYFKDRLFWTLITINTLQGLA
jgi:MFS transporter, MCT family, solute carrier family 16 (monocarboxylic acid transporters), member 10